MQYWKPVIFGGMYLSAEEPTRSLCSQMSEQGELTLIGGENHKTGQGPDTKMHYNALENVGQYSEKTPNLYIATGFGKWGMTNSIASAKSKKIAIISDCYFSL